MKLSLYSTLFATLTIHTIALATTTPPSPSKTQLKYFDIRGAAETCRVILALSGEPYEDTRYQIDPKAFKSQSFEDAKSSGELVANLNRAPVLVTSTGQVLGQSRAIERYLCKKFGFMGQSAEEEAMIDCIAEHCRDVKDAARYKGFSKFAKGTEEEKEVLRKEWFTSDLPTLLGKINDAVGAAGSTKGYSVGDAVSYADVVIWAMLRDCYEADVEDTNAASKDCDVLNAIADNVANHPKVKEWVENRPVTMF
mmetsp:Transcript_16881/g.23139  ORF Transcript_16881/g.23139 Transcript_16881/m.23139 type:complete len:253 (-) Transcript_16881:44-802(-)|eukprot:CAMPEP_0185728282 /NCGR_PEP_ID=MMETSP1171-20130828/3680_1 /TAXON_ID=374046 /ORGANISM="Helicotheca tamensis, Strain CCMP826" /LENGTH=252 /DNA_ID=CAMNT_0028396971 /DNA_START=123 /DNA_END=881 /DNA_ORIENTATION=+